MISLGIFAVVVAVAVVSQFIGRPAAASTKRTSVKPTSPVPGVSESAWAAWEQANVVSEAERERCGFPDRTPRYGLRPRELVDVGMGGPGLDEQEAFVRVSRKLAGLLTRSHAALLGEVIEGAPASLSGLMAVARYAGLGGLSSWCADAEERARFGDTTAAYQRCNGLF